MERNFDALKRAEYRPFSKIECFSLLTAESGEVKFMAYADSQRSYYLEIKGGVTYQNLGCSWQEV